MLTHLPGARRSNQPRHPSPKRLNTPTAAATLSAPFRRIALATSVVVIFGVLASAAQATAPGVASDIVFQRYLAPENTQGSIFTIAPDGTDEHQITASPPGMTDRFPDFGPHSERVALVARELATVAGMSPAMVDQIYMAGLLHDVGKIGVPEAVLKKPGKLTAEEFEQMKQHPEIGAHILRDVRQLEPVIPGVLHHHERWDGRGYPAKLAGENIPLAGRILCLADCFDAMTSNRTYRPALPFDTALSEIRNGAGTQFDPELAAAFLRISQERLLELTAGHHEQAHKLIEEGRLRVA